MVSGWRVMDHEFIHYLRDKTVNVFQPSQWKILARKARKKGHLATAQEVYGQTPGYGAEQIEEEGVGNLFRDNRKSDKPDPFVTRMWSKITNTVERTGNAFRGLGFKSAQDVMDQIRSGEIAQQPSRSYEGFKAELLRKRDQPLYSDDVAKRYGVKEATVNAWFERYVQEREAEQGQQKDRDWMTRLGEEYLATRKRHGRAGGRTRGTGGAASPPTEAEAEHPRDRMARLDAEYRAARRDMTAPQTMTAEERAAKEAALRTPLMSPEQRREAAQVRMGHTPGGR